jgi:hypothetical protein
METIKEVSSKLSSADHNVYKTEREMLTALENGTFEVNKTMYWCPKQLKMYFLCTQ